MSEKLTRFRKGSETDQSTFDKNSSYDDPYVFDKAKHMQEDEAVVFRFINLSEEFVPQLNGVKASVFNTKTSSLMNNIHVPKPNTDDFDIQDDAGVDLKDLLNNKKKYSSLKLVPIYLLFKLNKEREIVENYDRLAYLPMNYSLDVSFKQMKENVDDDSAFDGALPPYSVMLTKTSTGKTVGPPVEYGLKKFSKFKQDKKTVQDHSLGIVDIEEAIGSDVWNALLEEGGPAEQLMEFLDKKVEEDRKPENIKMQFNRYRDGASKSSGNSASVDSVESLESNEESSDSEEPESNSSGRRWAKK